MTDTQRDFTSLDPIPAIASGDGTHYAVDLDALIRVCGRACGVEIGNSAEIVIRMTEKALMRANP